MLYYIFDITFPLYERVHYWECQDVISNKTITGAFTHYGYTAVKWDGEIYQAELVVYPSGGKEVFIGEWIGPAKEFC